MFPSARVGPAVFHDHLTPVWENGIGDVFVLNASPHLALPPWLWGKVVYEASKVLARLRRGACIWLRVPPVETTGWWWRQTLVRSARTAFVPVAIGDKSPLPQDFHYPPAVHPSPLPAGKVEASEPLTEAEESVLGVMARVGDGYTSEVASLALISLPTARKALRSLQSKRVVFRRTQNRWPYWSLSRSGISMALRMWGVPVRARFRVRAERRSRTAYKHRRTARLWNAWLKKAGYEVLGGWSEVSLPGVGRHAPDALAWGRIEGGETLYWLEVDAGHRSRRELAAKAQKRLLVAQGLARIHGVRLVFAVLGPPWVIEAISRGMVQIEPFTAVLLGNWNDFGMLPKVRWGWAQKE